MLWALGAEPSTRINMINPKMIVMLLAMVCFILNACGFGDGRATSIGLALLTLGLLLT